MTQYFVKPGGNDALNGQSIGNAWATINKAVNTLVAGDTCDVLAGVYAEGGLELANSGADGTPITLRNYQNDLVKITGNGADNFIIRINGQDWWVFEGIDFEWQNGFKNNAYMIWSTNNADDDIIYRDCKFYDKTHGATPQAVFNAGYNVRGIRIQGARVEVDNCEFENIQHGIIFDGNALKAWIHDCLFTFLYQNGVIPEGNYADSGSVIEDCIFENSYIEDGIQFDQLDNVSYNNQGFIIRRNVFRNNAENAIDLKGCTNIFIEDNTFYGQIGSSDGPVGGWNRNAWTVISKGAAPIAKDITIRRNVFYDNCPGIKGYDGYKVHNNIFVSNNRDWSGPDQENDGHNHGGPFAFKDYGAGDDHALLNNIFANHNEAELQIQFRNPAIDIDHNLYIAGAQWADWNATDDWDLFVTLAAWRAFIAATDNELSSEQNSIQVASFAAILFADVPNDPDDVTGDHENFDFHILSASPAKNAGRHLTNANGGGVGITALVVDDARFFRSDFGNEAGVAGDTIDIGGGQERVIDAVNYGTNTLTLATPATWNDGDPIYPPYSDSAPDIGVYEFTGQATIKTGSATLAGIGDLSVAATSPIGGQPTPFDLRDLYTEIEVVEDYEMKIEGN